MAASWWRNALAAGLLVLAGRAAADPAPTVPVRFPDGFTVEAEVARTDAERARGLMMRAELPYNSGMLFVYASDEARSIWMKNTPVSLDIIFLDADRRVREVFESVPPALAGTPDDRVPAVRSQGQYILEAPAGTVRRRRLRAGDVLEFTLDP